MKLFLNRSGQVRNIWWVAVFFGVLALITVPFILLFKAYKWEITMTHQALIVVAASWICQLIRKKPFKELTGVINYRWFKHFLIGSGTGAALMLFPALFLYLGGCVSWQTSSVEIAFDKVENHFTIGKKRSEWSLWVRTLRTLMKLKRK